MLLKSNSTKLELTTTTTSQQYDYVRHKLLIKLYLIVNTMLKESQMGLGGWEFSQHSGRSENLK